MLDFLHKSKRIQIQEFLKCRLRDNFSFPRMKSATENTNSDQIPFPNNDQIYDMIKKAEERASQKLNDVGIEYVNIKTGLKEMDVFFGSDSDGDDNNDNNDNDKMLISIEELEEELPVNAEQLFENVGTTIQVLSRSTSSNSSFKIRNKDGTDIQIKKKYSSMVIEQAKI